MKFSIVTISYNQAAFLECAMQSVLTQDHPDLEYIVVDPGSTDGSRSIIEAHRDRLERQIFEPDGGPASGLNKGFAAATGDVLGFVNSDDALLPGALAQVDAFLSSHPEVDVVAGRVLLVDQHDRVLARLWPTLLEPRALAYAGAAIVQQATFFRRRAYQAVGGFNPANRTCWDAELFLDMALAGMKSATLDADLGVFRMHMDSLSGSRRLSVPYESDRQRMFRKAIGRDRRWYDAALRAYYRLRKWFLHPRAFLDRLRQAIQRGGG